MKLKLHKTNALIRSSILTLLVLFAIGYIHAQSINTTVASSINNVFSPLEKKRIPHNILLDYGIEFIDISKYDGVLLTDNHTSISMYKDLYNTLVSSATSAGVSGLLSPTLENTEWQTLQQQQNNVYKGSATAPLILNGLYYNYSKIRTDALSTNKIQVVNGKYDDKYIGGVWQNPYESKIAFAITAPVQNINQPTVVVSLPTTLWHTNETISNIAVDLGNGNGYKNLNSGTTATETYTSVGLYTWTYRVQLTNGQYKYCRQKINITAAASGGQARSSGCGNVRTLPPINATRAYLGIFGSATLQIAYGSSDCKLRKPLIVAEGLDTGFFAASGSIGDYDINTFFQRVDESNSTELKNLIINDTSIDYDIVFVNWDNGIDYLQRNAYVLQAVINYVNQQKAINGSTEPNVVLGQSMGGLIARYALRDMENRSETHDTSLYISHDAPHQGANAPLGFLYMARHAVNQFIRTPLGNIDIPISSGNVGLGNVEDLLNAPGVKQMLINNVSSSFALDNALHTSWQTELKNMGYPQQTRNVALSNASHCAELQDVKAGDRIFTLDAFGKTSFLTDIALSITGLGAYSGILASVVLDEAGFLLGILPGSSRFDMNFWVNAYPSSGTAQIYYGRMKYKKTLLWLLPINVTITERSYNSPSGMLPIDSYPGGVNHSFKDIDVNTFKSGVLGKYGFTIALNPNFGFIPVASALDVGSNNTTLNNADYLKVYTKGNPPTGNKTIPFDNFMTSFNTSSINEPHISFNKLNGDWLAEELDTDSNTEVFDCSLICSETNILGNDTICINGYYSLPTGASNYNWSITEGNSLVSMTGNGTPNITLTNNGSISGHVTIRVTYGKTTCGNVILTKRIWVGEPVISPNEIIVLNINSGYNSVNGSGTYEDPFLVCEKTNYLFRGTNFPPLDMSSFTFPYGWYGYSEGGNDVVFTTGDRIDMGDAIVINFTGVCGNSSHSIYFAKDPYSYCFEGYYRYSVVPNPITTSQLTILSKKDGTTKESMLEPATEVEFLLFDYQGIQLKSNKDMTNKKEYQLNVSNLKQGIYYLKVITSTHTEVHRILVDR